MADIGNAQLAVDGLAKDPVDPPAVYGLGVGYWPAGYARFEKRVNKIPRSARGQSQESTGLVSGEKSGVQADQSDPLSLKAGETKRPQQFFSSLQVGNHGFPGLGHGVCMPAASRLLKAFGVSKRAVVRVFSRAWRLAHTLSLPSVEGDGERCQWMIQKTLPGRWSLWAGRARRIRGPRYSKGSESLANPWAK